MKWSELCIHTTNEAIEPISNILHEAGASGVVIEDVQELSKERETYMGEIYELNPEDYPEEGVYVKAYLPVNSFLGETVEAIKSAINQLLVYEIDLGHNNITISELNEEDWATSWKKYYKPVKISEKFTIIPTWEEYERVSSDEIIMELDPGMAFGTGTHPTTVLSIQAIEQYVQKDDVIIDVGTGSGVLSIAAILLGAKQSHAYDLDDIAVKSATNNAKLNKVDNQILAKQNNLLDYVDFQADMIVANILAEVIVRFTDQAYDCVKDGGYFITSGIIQNKRQEVKDELVKSGFEIVEINQMDDWTCIIARKPVHNR
ncbi:50S ribosomal protein L11 methyltransferase [Pontibacillus litoralis]|uniref:Ribosomal protein L11 methyltransferase n=1 Tax=Pontibacillus litoralis JSM 072002 TaxID=1385512 RepID=A0A0A5GCR9_9BACI|nr:50S ribosomal protein L11 methyltransferase [Pontibacillus litoralis]KGX88925.1 ribosomal protein L11 methyltransferase [Pontibacillus litoralis JSM 072002]